METNIKKLDVDLSKIPDNIASPIMDLLQDKNYRKRVTARKKLVSMGKMVLPEMVFLLASKNNSLRKEAAKVIELIADKKSIPVFIKLLDDTDSSVRWIGAEGLIRIGRDSIIPLLKFIRDKKSSYFQKQGAHHVFTSLFDTKEKNELKQLLNSLAGHHELSETSVLEASKALKTCFIKE